MKALYILELEETPKVGLKLRHHYKAIYDYLSRSYN